MRLCGKAEEQYRTFWEKDLSEQKSWGQKQDSQVAMCCPTNSPSLNNVLNKSATLPVISSSVGVYKPSNASTYTYKSLHA